MVLVRPLLSLFLATAVFAQDTVFVNVNASQTVGSNRPIWSYFGYDEPNYTTSPNGRKLIGELASLSPTPVSIRVHNLLTTGDGQGSLKWGSTNAYTEDASGKPIYNWTVTDGIFDTVVKAGGKPFVEIGFMPEALSTHPEPYRHRFPEEKNVFTGWSYPPTDYSKWSELVYQWAKHCTERYGRQTETWNWEVWNEPDIPYWHGTPAEYNHLYDQTVAAVRRAIPHAIVGGPASTGPANPKAAAFLRQFLEHCASTGAPLDFITFHAKGSPKIDGSEVRMGLAKHMRDISEGFAIVRSFPRFKDLPIILSESDPEGCAACSAPQNAYRNGTLYAVYMAASLNLARQLAHSSGVDLEGFLTWAFEFERQPYFAGLRSLATNGVDQPVLNVFRMSGLMSGSQVAAHSSNSLTVSQVLTSGVSSPMVDVFATRSDHGLSVLLWNYADQDRTDESAHIALEIKDLPSTCKRPRLQHFRIDGTHSNSYTAWKSMNSPQHPDAAQQAALEAAGQLQSLASPSFVTTQSGTLQFNFDLPLQGISLLQLSW